MSKFCIAVGHGKSKNGGYDSGAISIDREWHEFKIAREIAKYAARALGCDLINYNGDMYLTDRIAAINEKDYDCVAEIHLNAANGTGTETFYHDSPEGFKAATAVCNEISKALSVRNRGPKIRLNASGKDYFAFIRQTRPTALLIETVFIDNELELEKVKTESGMRKCGEAIARGITSAYGTEQDEEDSAKKPTEAVKRSFKVRITTHSLYIRSGAGTNFKTVGTVKKNEELEITETSPNGNWGKLRDGRGWVSVNEKYVRRL